MKSKLTRIAVALTALVSCAAFAQTDSASDQARRQRNVDEVLARHHVDVDRMNDNSQAMPEEHRTLRARTHHVAQKTRAKTHEIARNMRADTHATAQDARGESHDAAEGARSASHAIAQRTRNFTHRQADKVRDNGHEGSTS